MAIFFGLFGNFATASYYIKIMGKLIKTENAEWIKVLDRTNYDFYHLPRYVELEASRIKGSPHAFLVEEGKELFFIPMIIRSINIKGERIFGYENAKDAISPYGYPCPIIISSKKEKEKEEFIEYAINYFIKEMHCRDICSVFIRLHPIIEAPIKMFKKFGFIFEHGKTVLIDLKQSEHEMWLQTRSTYRNNIKNMQRNGFSVKIDEKFDKFDIFLEIYEKTMNNLKADKFYYFGKNYLFMLKEILGKKLKLCIVEKGNDVMAAGLFTECQGIVQYHLSGTRQEKESKDTTKLMIDFIRTWAKNRGNKYFHLGGGVGSKNDQLFFFKSGFSKLQANYYTWRIISHKDIYEAAIKQKKEIDNTQKEEDEDFFPAYRK